MRQKFKLLLLFFIFISAATLGFSEKDFDTLKKTVQLAINRLEFSLETDEFSSQELKTKVTRQIDLAAIAIGCISLEEDSFFNLAHYLVFMHFKKSALALKHLRDELSQDNISRVRRWIRTRIESVENDPSEFCAIFSLETEIESLKQLLKP